MKVIFFFIALLLVCMGSTAKEQQSKIQARSAVHEVVIMQPLNSVFCSGYSVGPHSLIIANHCLGDYPQFDLLAIDESRELAVVEQAIGDGNDHTILILHSLNVVNSWRQFDSWVNLDIKIPIEGERVFTYGASPILYEGHWMYREGYFSGFGFNTSPRYKGGNALVFNLTMLSGDSGSLIFNRYGKVVGEVSQTTQGMTGSYEFRFTNQELAQIR